MNSILLQNVTQNIRLSTFRAIILAACALSASAVAVPANPVVQRYGNSSTGDARGESARPGRI